MRINPVDKALNVDLNTLTQRALDLISEGSRIGSGTVPHVDLRAGFTRGDVIRFVLCKRLAKLFADKVRARVALHRQVPAVEGIQVVKADREVVTERIGGPAQHFAVVLEHEQIERAFQALSSGLQHEAILRRDQFKGTSKGRNGMS